MGVVGDLMALTVVEDDMVVEEVVVVVEDFQSEGVEG